MLTKKEISQKADIPISTVKYYMEHYAEFFRGHNVDGRTHPVYEEEAIEVVQLVSKLTAERKSRDEIREILAETFEPIETYVLATSKVDDKSTDKSATIDASNLPVHRSIEAASSAIVSLNRMNDELGIVIRKLESDVESRDKVIAEKDKHIAERDQTITQLETDKKKQQEQIEKLESELEEEKKKYGFGGLWKRNE